MKAVVSFGVIAAAVSLIFFLVRPPAIPATVSPQACVVLADIFSSSPDPFTAITVDSAASAALFFSTMESKFSTLATLAPSLSGQSLRFAQFHRKNIEVVSSSLAPQRELEALSIDTQLDAAYDVLVDAAVSCGVDLQAPKRLPPPSTPAPPVDTSVVLVGEVVPIPAVECLAETPVPCSEPHTKERFKMRTVAEDSCERAIQLSSDLLVEQGPSGADTNWRVTDARVLSVEAILDDSFSWCEVTFTEPSLSQTVGR